MSLVFRNCWLGMRMMMMCMMCWHGYLSDLRMMHVMPLSPVISCFCQLLKAHHVTSKAAARLHFLKQLKCSGAGRYDLLCLYSTVIWPVLEYACPVWCADESTGVTAVLSAVHHLWRQWLYDIVDSSQARHAGVTARTTDCFFKHSVLPETSYHYLHYPFPVKCDVSVTGRLRHARTLEPLKSRTVKFRHSFIPCCLDHYV